MSRNRFTREPECAVHNRAVGEGQRAMHTRTVVFTPTLAAVLQGVDAVPLAHQVDLDRHGHIVALAAFLVLRP